MNHDLLERLTGYGHHPSRHSEYFLETWPLVTSPDGLREQWKHVCRDAGKSKTVPELHNTREDYLRVLEGYTHLLKASLLLAEHERGWRLSRTDLQRAYDDVLQLHSELTTCWVTLDDLYRIVAEHLSLTANELVDLAAQHPAPQQWYDEEFDPFTPED